MNKGKPLHAKNDESRCQAITFETAWKRDHATDLRCPFIAKIQINQKHLCHRHAHLEALAIMIKDGKAQIIPQPERRNPYQQVSITKP